MKIFTVEKLFYGGHYKMAKKGKDYFGIGWLPSVILAIIPVTSLICGILTRFKEKHYLAGIIRLLVGWNLWWLFDLISMIFTGKILRVL